MFERLPVKPKANEKIAHRQFSLCKPREAALSPFARSHLEVCSSAKVNIETTVCIDTLSFISVQQ